MTSQRRFSNQNLMIQVLNLNQRADSGPLFCESYHPCFAGLTIRCAIPVRLKGGGIKKEKNQNQNHQHHHNSIQSLVINQPQHHQSTTRQPQHQRPNQRKEKQSTIESKKTKKTINTPNQQTNHRINHIQNKNKPANNNSSNSSSSPIISQPTANRLTTIAPQSRLLRSPSTSPNGEDPTLRVDQRSRLSTRPNKCHGQGPRQPRPLRGQNSSPRGEVQAPGRGQLTLASATPTTTAWPPATGDPHASRAGTRRRAYAVLLS